jgi:acetyl esterase/lipase
MMNALWFPLAAVVLCVCSFGMAAGNDAPATTQASAPRMLLWEKTPDVVEGKDTDTDPTVPTLDAYLVPGGSAGAAVVIFPGGGYTHLSTIKEGRDVALMFNAHQISAFVLRYRHGMRYHNPIPLEDAQRAMRLIRSKAAEFNIDPHRLGVLGFSAGGHLAATLATEPDHPNADAPDPVDRFSARPDFAALLYPVITFVDAAAVHKGSREALVGQDEALWESMSAEKRVTKDTPPVFIAQAETDKTVPVENSLLFFEACHKAGVPAELHVFPSGPHGFGLAPTNPVLNVWPEYLIHWMMTNHWIASAPQ